MKLIIALLIIASVVENCDVKGDHMPIKCFELNPKIKYPYFEIDLETGWPDFVDQFSVEQTETAWNEKIPGHLHPIGGPMLVGWIKMCRDDNDPEGIFRGEYMDGEKRYKGQFRFFHPEGKPIPENLFQDYYLSSFADENNGVSIDPIVEGTSPDFFYLRVAEPEKLERPQY